MTQQFYAKHQSATGKPLVQVTVPTYYSLDEAARALAQVYPEIPAKFGKRSVNRGLTEAATRGIRGKRETPDPEAVALYRQKLTELEVFPADDQE